MVETAEGLKDHFERVGTALGGGVRAEGDRALVAVPALENLVLFVALAYFLYIFVVAVDTTLDVSTYEWALVGFTVGLSMCFRVALAW